MKTLYQDAFIKVKRHPVLATSIVTLLLLIPPLFNIVLHETHPELTVERLWILLTLLIWSLAAMVVLCVFPMHFVVVTLVFSLPLFMIWIMTPYFLLLPVSLGMMGVVTIMGLVLFVNNENGDGKKE